MNYRIPGNLTTPLLAVMGVAIALSAPVPGHAQRGQRGGAPQTAQAAALIDLTGYWVSVVTEEIGRAHV